MKSAKTLASFVAYCEAHPGERFWQALRNWSGYEYIFVSNNPRLPDVVDTFHWEGKGAASSEQQTQAPDA